MLLACTATGLQHPSNFLSPFYLFPSSTRHRGCPCGWGAPNQNRPPPHHPFTWAALLGALRWTSASLSRQQPARGVMGASGGVVDAASWLEHVSGAVGCEQARATGTHARYTQMRGRKCADARVARVARCLAGNALMILMHDVQVQGEAHARACDGAHTRLRILCRASVRAAEHAAPVNCSSSALAVQRACACACRARLCMHAWVRARTHTRPCALLSA